MRVPYAPPGERLLKRSSAAHVLGVSGVAVTAMARRGELEPVVSPSGQRSYRMADLLELRAARDMPEEASPEADRAPGEGAAFRAPDAAKRAGISYRQIDYWDRIGLLGPSLRGAGGSGSWRLYSSRDVELLRTIRRLLDAGLSLQQVRAAIGRVQEAYPDGTEIPDAWSADLAPGIRVVVSDG